MDRYPRIAVLAMAAGLFVSCSIKSDRSDCPCRLSIVMPSPPERMELTMLRGGERRLDTVLFASDFDGGVCSFAITKGKYVFSAHDGCENVAQGSQADSLYAWSSVSELDATGDELTLYPGLGKQFATLFVEILTEDSGECDCDLVFGGEIDGLDITSLLPVRGLFRYRPERESSGEYSVRIPRQNASGEGLSLELSDDDGHSVLLPIARYVSSTGYDWTEESLKDIYVSVNCAFSGFGIDIEDWRVGFTENLEL